eukprot:Hpha_TRINITY_DN14673_c2_g1::TRINITY_DN14673_c2_g1_i1::g.48514::m.48514
MTRQVLLLQLFFLALTGTSSARVVGGTSLQVGATDRLVELSWRTVGTNTSLSNRTKRDAQLASEAALIMDRLAPLYRGVLGDQWLIICFGWLLDLNMLFTGSAEQPLPITNLDAPQWNAGNATYDDVRSFVAVLKTAAANAGLPRLKFGALFVGWTHLYRVQVSEFSRLHPELFHGAYRLGHDNSMKADSYPYASQPGGARANQSWPTLFGSQWGVFSKFAGLDGIVVRDGLSTYTNYERMGPFGAEASQDPARNEVWSNGFRSVFKEIKTGNPDTKVMGYSNAASAVGEWVVGLTDVETLVADGYMDAWIDQSWSGAWQDVPTRRTSALGWTHQLHYILAHRAQIEGGNRRRNTTFCKHYVLHDTFDAFEGWDTIHNVPQKLRWGIWAYNHAALERNDSTLVVADGQYVSWANSWSYVLETNTRPSNPLQPNEGAYLQRPLGLLTRTDVSWLASELNTVEASVSGLQGPHVPGPALVYDRDSFAKSQGVNTDQWLDEQAGMLAKLGTPILAVRLMQDGPDPSRKGGYIMSVPSSAATKAWVEWVESSSHGSGGSDSTAPLLVLGRADAIDSKMLALAGAEVTPHSVLVPAARVSVELHNGTTTTVEVLSKEEEEVQLSDLAPVTVLAHGQVVAQAVPSAHPLIVSSGKNGPVMWAQLNDWAHPNSTDISMENLGSPILFSVVSQFLRTAAARNKEPHVIVPANVPVAFNAFQSRRGDGSVGFTVLVGNLESDQCGSDPKVPSCTLAPSDLVEASVVLFPGPSDAKVGSCWSLTCSDGEQLPSRASASADGSVTFGVHLRRREAHAFQLRP